MAAVIAADGSVRQDSKSSARWYRCFKKGPTAMVAHCEEGSAPGEISIQVSSAEAQLDVFKFGKHGTTSMIGCRLSLDPLLVFCICILHLLKFENGFLRTSAHERFDTFMRRP